MITDVLGYFRLAKVLYQLKTSLQVLMFNSQLASEMIGMRNRKSDWSLAINDEFFVICAGIGGMICE